MSGLTDKQIANSKRKQEEAKEPKLNSDLDMVQSMTSLPPDVGIYRPSPKKQISMEAPGEPNPSSTIDQRELNMLRKDNSDLESLVDSLKQNLQAKTVECNKVKKKLQKYEKNPDAEAKEEKT
jgi:hypothetical protein